MKELFTALSKAQAVMHGAVKDSNNPFFKSTYADLESVWEAVREPLTQNGLSVVQTTEVDAAGKMVLVTYLCHSSGESIRGVYPILAKDDSPQSIKSSVTYARRTALSAIVGLWETDDDGNLASGKEKPVPQKPAVIQQQQSSPQQPAYDEWAPIDEPAFFAPDPAPRQPQEPKSELSEPQIKRFWAMTKALRWSNEDAHTHIKQKTGKESVKLLTRKEYKEITDAFSVEIDKNKHNQI